MLNSIRQRLHLANSVLEEKQSRNQQKQFHTSTLKCLNNVRGAGVLHTQSYPGYPNTFGQRSFIGCSDKRNCSDNPNETFLAIYILYNIKSKQTPRSDNRGFG